MIIACRDSRVNEILRYEGTKNLTEGNVYRNLSLYTIPLILRKRSN